MNRAIVAVCLLAACRDKPIAQPATGDAGPGKPLAATAPAPRDAAAVDPWVQPDAASDTPEARRKRADAALGRVATIKIQLAKLRSLSFDHELPTAFQSAAEFRAFVHREIAKELPPDQSKDLSAALFHVGLLTKPIDLAEVEEQAATTQAGAYYDPAVKSFFLVMVPDSELMLDTISAHELTHGLQDQHFDLIKYLPPKLDDDAATARRFVVEGDATFTMLLYAVGKDKINPAMLGVLRGQIEKFSSLDLAGLKDMTRQQSAAFSSMDGDIKKSIDAMDDIPATVLVPMLDSYMKGALVDLIAYQQGGWPAVDALFRNPPESTEQVLHPATKLFPNRDRPHRVSLAVPAGARPIADNVMGELQWSIYFGLWKPDLATKASEGWGGDRYMVVRRADGRLVATTATIWDTPADAKEFADAYLASLAVRFPGSPDPTTGVTRPGGGKVFVRTLGTKVFIVDGVDEPTAVDAAIKSTKFD